MQEKSSWFLQAGGVGVSFLLSEFFFLNLAKISQKTSSKLVSILSRHEKV